MLSYSAYYDALAATRDPKSPEWDMTVAGLVVLRLADEWLNSGRRSIVTDAVGLKRVRDLIDKIPDVQPLRNLLYGVLRAVQCAERTDVPTVAPSLTRYARELYHLRKLPLAEASLRPLLDRAIRAGDDRAVMHISRELGLILRESGKFDEAMENYNISEKYAKKLGDIPNQLLPSFGKMKIIAARGNFDLADTISADIVAKADAIGDPKLQSMAAHDRGFIAGLMSDSTNAILSLRKALACGTQNREHIIMDLVTNLTFNGHNRETLSDNLRLAVFAKNSGIRCQATMNLMCSAYLDGNLQRFELYRSSLRLAPLVPWWAIRYHHIAMRGYRSFGQFDKANEELRKARTIASKHGIKLPILNETVKGR